MLGSQYPSVYGAAWVETVLGVYRGVSDMSLGQFGGRLGVKGSAKGLEKDQGASLMFQVTWIGNNRCV